MTFTQAREILGNRDSKKVANNTYLIPVDYHGEQAIGLRLHNTVILTYRQNGEVIVNTGGWQTVTTKARINEYLPFGRLYQKAGVWYWGWNDEIFHDGDILNADTGTFIPVE